MGLIPTVKVLRMPKRPEYARTLLYIDELVIWSCGAVLLYSVTLISVALVSRLNAERLQSFGVCHQGLLLVVAIASSISLATGLIVHPVRAIAVMGTSGWLLNLISIQPSASCCEAVIAWASGAMELKWNNVLEQTLPIVGSGLLICAVSRISTTRRRSIDVHKQRNRKKSRKH